MQVDVGLLRSPIEEAAAIYEREPCKRTFQEDLASHLLGGYVFSSPDLFLMGRPIDSDAPYEQITDPCYKFDRCNSWLVYLAVCRRTSFLDKLFRYEPYPLPFIGFERRNKLRFYRREQLLAKCSTANS